MRREDLKSGRDIRSAMTAHNGEDVRKACKEAGMNGFLSKPVKEAEIAQAFKRCK
jgi:CheY-like chemotaxis protein